MGGVGTGDQEVRVLNWQAYIDPTEDGAVGTIDRFMEATADLDFDLPAIVIRSSSGQMLGFLSPGYLALGWEKEFALCAGREAVSAARAAIAAWLKELGE